jgi:hypothetical protein
MSEKITKEYIWAEVARIHESDDLAQNETGAILLASLVVGARNKAIAEFLDIPVHRVSKRSPNLRCAGIWQGTKVDADEWFQEEHGSTDFILCQLVADGLLERRAA